MSIPLVKGFRDGPPSPSSSACSRRAAIEAFLDRLVPSETDRLVAEGDEDSLRQAVEREPGHVGARVALARLLLRRGPRRRGRRRCSSRSPSTRAPRRCCRGSRLGVGRPARRGQAGLAALDRGDTEQGLTHLIDAVRVADPELKRRPALGAARRLRRARRAPPALGPLPPPAGPGALLSRCRFPAARRSRETQDALPGPRRRRPTRAGRRLLSLGQEPRWHRFLAGAPAGAAGRPRARRRHRHRRRRGRAGRAAHRCRVTGARPERRHARRRPRAPGRGGVAAPRRARARRGRARCPSRTARSTASRSPTCCATSTTRRPSLRRARPRGPPGRHARQPGLRRAAAGAGARRVAALHRGAAAGGGPRWWAAGPGGGRGASCTRASPTSTGATRCRRCSSSTAPPACRDLRVRRLSLGGGVVVWGVREG